MYNLVNVPMASAKDVEIRPLVDGAQVMLVCAKVGAPDNQWVRMEDTYIGDHLLLQPQALREKIAQEMAYLVRAARDVGYAHAQYEIRRALGLTQR